MKMRAIILAAGMGLRLDPLTNNIPKCLVDVNGKSILKRELEILEGNRIEEAVIVVGYMKNKVIEEIGDYFGKMKIFYIKNDIFDRTNNSYSLWLAKEHLKGGGILIEGDILFEDKILSKLLDTDKNKSYWVVDKFAEGMNGCMLTTTIDNSQIQNIQIVRSKIREIKNNYFKSVGILKISSEFGILFSRWLEDHIRKKKMNMYYDLVIAEHINKYPLYIYKVNNLKWSEIDDLKDLKKAKELFRSK